MIIYYGRLGLIASLALIIYGLISLFIFKAIPLVLTLPGVAGFILSIGMAVDSNILIFERIKEEQRKGRGFDIAVRLGFGHAIDAIKDANITTLIVAFISFNPLNWEFLAPVWDGKRICFNISNWSGDKFIYGSGDNKKINKYVL